MARSPEVGVSALHVNLRSDDAESSPRAESEQNQGADAPRSPALEPTSPKPKRLAFRLAKA